MKVSIPIVTLAVAATAAAVAYSSLKPSAKSQLKRDIRTASRDMNDIKESMCDMGQDVTKMTKNLTQNM